MNKAPRVFLDTDVILDFVLRRKPFFPASAQLFQAGTEGKLVLLASAAAMKDVFYFARKATKEEAAKGKAEGNEKRGREVVRLLMEVLEPCMLDGAMWKEALASPLRDTEDALQVACALRHKADFLVTRNVADYGSATLPQVLLPELLLALLDRR